MANVRFAWRGDAKGRIIGHLQGLTRQRTHEISKKIFEGVVDRTPVDSGYARANWIATIGTPSMVALPRNNEWNYPKPHFHLPVPGPYQRIHIVNNAPYIERLEYGWSEQAPIGMVRVTLAGLGVASNVRVKANGS